MTTESPTTCGAAVRSSDWLGRVLVACEYSGSVRDAFAALGWDAWSCDLLPSEKPGNHRQCDVREVLNEGWDIMVAHPPCTHLAVSGARWFKDKVREQAEALDFVRLLLAAPIPHIALENPVSIISSKVRKPDQVIQPWQHGHGETKATCLWLKNLPKITPTDILVPEWAVNPDGSTNFSAKRKRDNPTHFLTGRIRVLKGAQREQWERIHRCPPGPDRWKIRSKTYPGIAAAFANQWTLATRPNGEISDRRDNATLKAPKPN